MATGAWSWRAKIAQYLTLPSLAAIAYWVLDHLLPDFLPKLPEPLGLSVVIGAGAVLLSALTIMGWRRLLVRMPRPWFPRPFFRIGFWLRHRPTTSIITVAPQVSMTGTTMDQCRLHLTLWRNLTRTPCKAVIRFDTAMLVLRQSDRPHARNHIFRPKEAGGLLHLPIPAQSVDSIKIEFAATGLPAPFPNAPDFSSDYRIELTGVFAEIQGRKPTICELPPVVWNMRPSDYHPGSTLPIESVDALT
ncbi:hypothetical protein MRBLMA1_002444 [Sphingobium sp. LMA1-1-1.1]|uniref:hypothetical protein n=1 Tax=Sphingobium sp. LMA1-1-1.1 TaxID=3135238 RepID=UPI003441F0FE